MTDKIFEQTLEQLITAYPNAKVLEATQPLSDNDFKLQQEKQASHRACGGVIGVVVTPDDKVVLAKRSVLHAGWSLPGGTVENGEDFREAFVREIKEEVGVSVYDINLAVIEKKQFISPENERLGFILAVFTGRINACKIPEPTEDAKVEGLTIALFPLESLPERMIFGDKEKLERYALDRSPT